MTENQRIKAEAYIRYFCHRSITDCRLTNEFIKAYQQEKNGYIELAKCFKSDGTNFGDKGRNVSYYSYLKSFDDITKVPFLKWMTREEIEEMKPVSICVNKEICEPNQKWHLIISYLGMHLYEETGIKWHTVSCPELWLWMFESSKVVTQEELKDIYEHAVAYKNKEPGYEEWLSYIKPFRLRLDETITKSLL